MMGRKNQIMARREQIESQGENESNPGLSKQYQCQIHWIVVADEIKVLAYYVVSCHFISI